MFISASNASSQEYFLREYGVKDGLPQSQIGNVLQDRHGFLWISTRNGLSRFDGVEFVNYTKKNGLPSNIIENIYEDLYGRLWVVSNQGLSEYTGKDFRYYPSSLKGTFLSPITGDSTGLFLVFKDPVTGKQGIVRFEKGVYSDYSGTNPDLKEKSVNTIYFDVTRSELLFTDSAFILWSWKNSKLKRVTSKKVDSIINKNGNIVCRVRGSTYEYIGDSLYSDTLTIPGASLISSAGTTLVKYSDGKESYELDLPFRAIACFIDREKTLWFPSDNNFIRLPSLAFRVLTNSHTGFAGTWAISEDHSGNLWLGTISGDLYMYDGKNMIPKNEFKKLFDYQVVFYKGSRLMSNGELWFSLNCGILIWDGSSFSRLKGLPEAQVCYIFEDVEKNRAFIGTDKGLFVKDKKGMHVFTEYTEADFGVAEGITRGVSGDYWVSGHRGISVFDGENPKTIRKAGFGEILSWTIENDGRGGIWASTDEGLFVCNEKDGRFTDGLPEALNKPANSLKLIGKDLLLVGRAADICLIDLTKFYKDERDYFRVYDITDGYPGDDCLDNGIVVSREGYCWILTSGNIVQFFPDRLKKNMNPPQISFTGFFSENDSAEWQPILTSEFYSGITPGIMLNRKQNRVKITFTAISMANPEKILFRHQMKGTGKENWSGPSERREVIYENLRPGKYTFSLKAINSDGIETPESSDIQFIISPALYETGAFRIIFVLTLVALTFFLSRFILRRNQKKKAEAARLKSHILKLQMDSVLRNFDPHFTFNAISSVGSLIMKSRKDEAYKYLTSLSSLLRTTLQDRSSVLKPLSEELGFVNRYCELQKLRFGNRFDYSINVGDNVDKYIEIPKMLIQTFVENAIKHGIEDKSDGGRVDVDVSQSEECLTIKIRDNGIGRKESRIRGKDGTGTGFATVKKIFDLENRENISRATFTVRDLSDENINTGTEVIIRIPSDFVFSLGRESADFYSEE